MSAWRAPFCFPWKKTATGVPPRLTEALNGVYRISVVIHQGSWTRTEDAAVEKTLRIDPQDPRPIWRQIEETVRHLVASGSLAAGTGVPSVRDLARELQVNPATVSKAYQRLTDAG